MPVSRPLRGPLRRRESHLWKRHALDWYVEPEWCSERLFEVEKFEGRIWDPACGLGRIVRAAHRAGVDAAGTDIQSRGQYRGVELAELDFFDARYPAMNIVCNPPYSIAEKFVAHALELAERKVAMLLPANWIQGDQRSRWLEQTPLCRVWFITPRPSMPPGPVIEAGEKPGNGTTDYAWFVWEAKYSNPPQIRWLRRDAAVAALPLQQGEQTMPLGP